MGPNDGSGSAAEGAESRAGEAQETLSVLGYRPKHQLEDLLGLVALARLGEGCPVMLLGEPGSGKTRLADSLCRWAKDEGIEVLWASCEAEPDAPEFWPWLQLLREYVRSHPTAAYPAGLEDRMGEVIEMLPEVDNVLRGLAVPESVEPAAPRFRFFDAVMQVLREASKDDALVVVLDDLQSGDAASLDLLRHVGNELWGTRILLLALSRPPTPRSRGALRTAIESLARARGSHRFELNDPGREAPGSAATRLSAREGEVAGLVRKGLTNREIAGKLFISERTAENHIQSILNKLGFTNRTQVAAWVERGEK